MTKPKSPKPNKGKKSKSWREDIQILGRLSKVEELSLANWSNRKIAKEIGVSEATIRRDIKRNTILWREEAGGNINDQRNHSIMNYRRLMRLAHEQFLLNPVPTWLRVQMDCESNISKLQGTIMPKELLIELNSKSQYPDDIKLIPTEELHRMIEESKRVSKILFEKLNNNGKFKGTLGNHSDNGKDEK